MIKPDRQRLRDEARDKLEKFWNEQVKPLHESAAATFIRLYQATKEKERAFMREVSSRLGLEVDDLWLADSPYGMPEGKYLACHAVEDRDGQVEMPVAMGMAKVSEWKYCRVRFLPYDSKLAHLVQRGKARLHREHMAAIAQEYDPYFDQIARAWREIGADDYLVGRLSRLLTFKEAWDLVMRRTSYRPMKESLDAFRKLHNVPPLSFREELEEAGVKVEKVVEPRNKELERAADALGIKSRVLEADIKELAWFWEEVISEVDSPTPPLLLTVLGYLVKAYLRGRDFRMGNYQGIWRHIWKKTAIVRLVIECAVKNAALASLHKAGLTSVEGFRYAVIRSAKISDYDVLEDVRQFLEGEGGD